MDSKSLSSLALLTLLAAVPARGGTVLTVDLLTDESDSPCIPGDCSLREALADATEDDEIATYPRAQHFLAPHHPLANSRCFM